MQPVAVGVLAQDPKRGVVLEVVKGEWTNVFRRCETDPKGQCDARFRTQGNFGLRVTPKNGLKAGYQLFGVGRKRSRGCPQQLVRPKAQIASVLKGRCQCSRVPGLRAGAVTVLILLVSTVAEAQHLKFIYPLPKTGSYPGGPNVFDLADRLGTEAFKKQENIYELADGFDPLSPDDKGLEPTYPTSPGTPSACIAERGARDGDFKHTPTSEACRDCGFSTALAGLHNTRYRLEKLRRLGLQTKNFVASSFAVGDSMAGATGIGGLAWVTERLAIEKNYKGFQAAYDAKGR